jgi:uncharacterized membrane protein (Fun14 family)
MSDETSSDAAVRVGVVRGQPAWKKILLTLSLILVGGGAVMYGTSYFQGTAKEQVVEREVTMEPSEAQQRGMSFVGGSRGPVTVKVEEIIPPDWKARYGPWLMQTGVSFILGFVLGYAFRQFVKTLAILLALGVALTIGLSFFNVINIDFSGVQTQYESSLHWLSDQGSRLKDFVLSYIPSFSAGTVGAIVGFLRR